MLSRRQFMKLGASHLAAGAAAAQLRIRTAVGASESEISANSLHNSQYPFGDRRIYYNNFAEHLLNAYNPNMAYPNLPNRWSDEDWRHLIDMIAAFGFNVFEFWLFPSLFSWEGIASGAGKEFVRQMSGVIDHARTRKVKVSMLCILTTVGKDWMTYCPNVESEWREVRRLWDWWTKNLPGLELIDIFPGDPGGCSRNGCTAETYIDKSIEIAELIKTNLPSAEIQLGTWGPPFWGWGIMEGPPGWKSEFIQKNQHTGWSFDRRRLETSMRHLLKRLPDFPDPTSVFINMGFNSNGDPIGEADARAWVREIAQTHRIMTWDFSLTEGENAITPHYRFDRLFRRRREERDSAPYSGGICFTMTPLLNQLSLFMSAQSFLNPDAEPLDLVHRFFQTFFGNEGEAIARYLPLFEVIPDWGNQQRIELSREDYHRQMNELSALLHELKPAPHPRFAFHPSVDQYREELLFFAGFFARLSDSAPDYDGLEREYWRRVYTIYDFHPEHVDPRPKQATANLMRRFKEFK